MDLEARFLDLCRRLGVETSDFYWKVLDSSYNEKDRFYHTFKHIERMLEELDRNVSRLLWPETVEWAIFWHDAFHSTKLSGKENEYISSQMSIPPIMHKSPEFRSRVEDLIMATCHDLPPSFEDAELMCDFDLVILGQRIEAYRDYLGRIRVEYDWVPFDIYKKERIKVLQGFLDKERIYHTNGYRKEYEAQARSNLKYEIDLLGEDNGDVSTVGNGS